MTIWRLRDSEKLLAPVVKKKERDGLKPYLERRGNSTGVEDLDDTMNLNPVMVARMAMNEGGRKKKASHANAAWKMGAIAKLKIGEMLSRGKGGKDAPKYNMANMDRHIKKEAARDKKARAAENREERIAREEVEAAEEAEQEARGGDGVASAISRTFMQGGKQKDPKKKPACGGLAPMSE